MTPELMMAMRRITNWYIDVEGEDVERLEAEGENTDGHTYYDLQAVSDWLSEEGY